ncbi:MAG TPA: hypothetical protein VGG76_04685 [Gemmatimonadaceae bacterium]
MLTRRAVLAGRYATAGGARGRLGAPVASRSETGGTQRLISPEWDLVGGGGGDLAATARTPDTN